MTDYESMTKRQIDAQIAERLFERKVEWARETWIEDGEQRFEPCPYYADEGDPFEGEAVVEHSTDWSAAGEVVERMWKHHDLFVAIECDADSHTVSVVFYAPGASEAPSSIVASGPLAICLATLRALDAREGKG